jgi:hypothetical protein
MKRIQMFSVLRFLAAAMDASAQVGAGLAMPSDFNFVFQYGRKHSRHYSSRVLRNLRNVPRYTPSRLRCDPR